MLASGKGSYKRLLVIRYVLDSRREPVSGALVVHGSAHREVLFLRIKSDRLACTM